MAVEVDTDVGVLFFRFLSFFGREKDRRESVIWTNYTESGVIRHAISTGDFQYIPTTVKCLSAHFRIVLEGSMIAWTYTELLVRFTNTDLIFALLASISGKHLSCEE